MKRAKAVIGAGFGDEGKGLTTDYFAAQAGGDALVVRHNGGAQAGHTVETPEGQRHVFSHIGSGSFAGAATFLSHFFVCNPLLFVKERALVAGKMPAPMIYVDAAAPVTTPYDMMINQIAEEARGAARHGSCGMGFGETLARGEAFAPLTYGELADTAALKQKLGNIRKNWLPQRLAALGITEVPPQWQGRIGAEGVLQKFIYDTAAFLAATRLAERDFLAVTKQPVIFEGAQGLLLDQQRGWFPHVTRSHTGLRNIVALAKAAGITALDVAYITRSYLTRHGAGPLPGELLPLPGELPQLPYPAITDKTNVRNDYQGTLRFAYLDLDLLKATIAADMADGAGMEINAGLSLTCLDQLTAEAFFMQAGHMQTVKAADFAAKVAQALNPAFLLQSRGPTRATIDG